MKKILFVFIFIAAVIGYVRFPKTARAETNVGCQQEMPYSVTNTLPQDPIFENFESHEYVNGFLVLHFKLKRGLNYNIQERWKYYFNIIDDQCRSFKFGDNGIIIQNTNVKNISFRFTSLNNYQIWNDDTNQPLTCTQCQGKLTIDIIPQNFASFFKIQLTSTAHYNYYTLFGKYTSTALYIQEQPTPPPIESSVLQKAASCPNMQIGDNIVDNYEKSKYADGFINWQFRHQPFVNANDWIYKFYLYDKNCQNPRLAYSKTEVPVYYAEYFSVKFTSPTHFIIWNDDINAPASCYNYKPCQGDLLYTKMPDGSVPSYVSFSVTNLAIPNKTFTSTPFPLQGSSGNSSVLFIPGLEASRLYEKGTLFENQLWDPNRHQDVQDLYLDETGKSLHDGIYTRDLVDAVDLSGSNIYKSFISTMDGLVSDKKIAEWKAVPYDWRFDYDKVLDDTNMAHTLIDLASRSDTGKVTIIAHSNGGLIAKKLISRLESEGNADLVDKLVLVAVPQSGTPKAMEVLLHGEDNGWIKGLFLPRWLTRGLAEYMQSAFNLLPTEAYFEKVIDPVVVFDPNSIMTERFRKKYGESITTAGELRSFLMGEEGRIKPEKYDTISPNLLLPNFIAKSEENANILDSWKAPTNIKVIQIAGWGLDTIYGIKYTDREETICDPDTSKCTTTVSLDARPLTVTDGDKTVISYSADKMEGEKWYIHLYNYNRLGEFKVNRDHGDIMEVSSNLDAIKNIIQNLPVIETRYLVKEKPVDPEPKNRLSVHSPVSIDIYDSENHHTGFVSVANSDFKKIEDQILNSQYTEFGEGKYVSFPNDGTYKAVIKGVGGGTFNLELEKSSNGIYSGGEIYGDIPVINGSIAEVSVYADGISPLSLDIDGNGTFDVSVKQGERISASSLMDILEFYVSNLSSEKAKKKFDKQIVKIEKNITKEKIDNAQKRVEKLTVDIQKAYKKSYISFDEFEMLMGVVNQIKEKII